jgi:zinc protease
MKHRSSLGLASLGLALALLCGRALAAESFPEVDIPYERFVLDNGLTLIVHEDHKAPLVAVHVVYKVGSRDERPGRSGFAHLFEHLMFNGSEHYDDEFMRALTDVGATNMNGMTTSDRTVYYETVPRSALDRVLWLESDRMGHLLGAVDQAKLDEQRGVVQNEKRQAENAPYGKIEELLAASTYPAGHPYSWTTIGSMEDLNAASLDDVKEWFTAHYGAANAVLVIAGDVKAQELREKVEQYFGAIPAGPAIKRASRWPARMSGERRAVMQDRVPQPEVHKTWNIPGYGERDAILLYLAASMLEADGVSGRLYERLVRKDRIATSVMTYMQFRDLGSQLQVSGVAAEGVDIQRVEAALDEEIAALLRDGPTARELQLAKTAVYASYARVEGAAQKASTLASGELAMGSPDLYKRVIGWIREASAKDVRDAARRWLGDGVFALQLEPIPEHKVAQAGVDRSRLPPVGAHPPLALPALKRATLSNGLRVALAEQHTAPVVDISLILDAGTAADLGGKRGVAEFTVSLLSKGTRSRDAAAITERSRELAASLSTASGIDNSTITLNVLKGQLQPSLGLLADVVVNASFPEDELDRLKEQTLAGVEQQLTDAGSIAYGVSWHKLFAESHAYANAWVGADYRKTLEAIQRADLVAFREKWLRPDNATLLVIGDTTLAEIVPMLERELGAWRAPSAPLPRMTLTPLQPAASARVYLVDRPGAEQTFILASSVAPTYSDPDHNALRAANKILGGEFLSRLNMNLREAKHWSYGVSSDWQRNKGPGFFSISAPVQADKTAESLKEIVAEIRAFAGEKPPTAEELKLARDSMVLKLPAGAETAGGVATFYRSVVTYALPDDYWNEFVGRVEGLGVPDLQAAARKLVRPDALTWVVVGNLAKIEAGVRALGLGEVVVVDVKGVPVR